MARCGRNPKDNWESIRYLNKSEASNEQAIFASYWEELTNLYGVRVEYYLYNYSLTGHDYLYGEETTASYSGPFNMNVLIDIPDEAILLSKFGLQTESDFTAIIPIVTFQDVFGVGAEPKSQDVVRLIESGWSTDELPPSGGEVLSELCTMTSPISPATLFYTVSDKDWVRCPRLYEITERNWQDNSMGVNTLQGHYVWIIRGKRFDYSYQPGLTPECKEGVVSDETTDVGILSGGTQDPSLQDPQPEKPYSDNTTEDSDENIWDYDVGDETRDDDVYGEY